MKRSAELTFVGIHSRRTDHLAYQQVLHISCFSGDLSGVYFPNIDLCMYLSGFSFLSENRFPAKVQNLCLVG